MTRNPPPPIDVRRLRAGEVALARAMNALFAEVFEAPDDYSARPPDDAYLVKLLGNDAVKSYITRHEPEILEHFELVVNTVSMEEAVQQQLEADGEFEVREVGHGS